MLFKNVSTVNYTFPFFNTVYYRTLSTHERTNTCFATTF